MRDILRAIAKTGSGSAAAMLFGVLSSKIMAVVLGPYGIGLYSVLGQLNQTSTMAGTLGGGPALVQGIASSEDDSRSLYIRTVFWLYISGGVITALVLVAFAPWIAQAVLDDTTASSIGLIRWVSLPVLLGVLLSFFNCVLNGFRAIGRMALIQAVMAATTALLSYPISLLVEMEYEIAFVGMLSASSCVGMILTFISASRKGWTSPIFSGLSKAINRDAASHFFSIAGTTLVVGLISTGTVLTIRSLIVQREGLYAAGIFNVAWMLSMTYVVLILGSFGTYYLPTLSQAKSKEARTDLMRQVFRASCLLMTALVGLVILIKPAVVILLYSDEFVSSLEIIRWMLIGDFFKVTGWVLVMPMVAYADMRSFLLAESLWSVGFLGLSTFSLLALGSIQGVGTAFVVMGMLYVLFTARYARRKYHFVPTRRMLATWIGGLALIALISASTWSHTALDWRNIVIWLSVLAIYLPFTLTKEERKRSVELSFDILRKIAIWMK